MAIQVTYKQYKKEQIYQMSAVIPESVNTLSSCKFLSIADIPDLQP
ncbi:hypothetical protein GXM_07192 [Nostoc sphaeroides CCNUC1]|uniref:Uncharacterized protein n=1 Tax=Nostoc sphaeroides CCNUC1 TaxID=2653204 RepID=A0A5P8WAA1_9NOSO|nr:hypothetical protein GXM_07192 [Nostoc sphaeroides CCNUC1]